MLVTPVGDRILVSIIEKETKENGLLIPMDVNTEELQRALVVVGGTYEVNSIDKITFHKNDVVWFSRQAARQIRDTEDGKIKESHIINMRDICAIRKSNNK